MKACSERVRDGITMALSGQPRAREPMNALVVWTELGKGLCGTLDQKGADAGLIGRIIDEWCGERGAAEVDLSRWLYRVEPSARLHPDELAATLARIEEAIERVLATTPEFAKEEDDGGRDAFLAVVKGWFPVGPQILRTFPAAQTGGESELRGALRAWCARYFPRDSAGPRELGVRVTRDG